MYDGHSQSTIGTGDSGIVAEALTNSKSFDAVPTLHTYLTCLLVFPPLSIQRRTHGPTPDLDNYR